MAIEPAKYLTYTEAVVHHIELMRALGEVRFGIFDRALIESALARPKHAATYDEADLPAQAATLCCGPHQKPSMGWRQQEDCDTPDRSFPQDKRIRDSGRISGDRCDGSGD